MELYETQGYYGSGHTPCTIFCAIQGGSTWYVVDGGTIVNRTAETVDLGADVEALADFDCFTAGYPINSLEELECAIEE